MLTEKKAWEKIAEYYAENIRHGICRKLDDLHYEEDIDLNTFDNMRITLQNEAHRLGLSLEAHFWVRDMCGAEQRRRLCLRLASAS